LELVEELNKFEYTDFCIDSADMADRYLDVGETYFDYLDVDEYDEESSEMDDSAYEEDSVDLEDMVRAYGLVSHEDALGLVGRSQVLYEMVMEKFGDANGSEIKEMERAAFDVDVVHRNVEVCLRRFYQMAAQLYSLVVDKDAVEFFKEVLSKFVGTIANVANAFAEQTDLNEVGASQIIGALEYFGLGLSLERLAEEYAIYFQFDFDRKSFSTLAGFATESTLTEEAMNYLQLAF